MENEEEQKVAVEDFPALNPKPLIGSEIKIEDK